MKNALIYKGFIGTVSFSSDDRIFYGKIEGIDDFVTFEGSTVEELESAFRYMVDQHLEDCEKEGKPAEKKESKHSARYIFLKISVALSLQILYQVVSFRRN